MRVLSVLGIFCLLGIFCISGCVHLSSDDDDDELDCDYLERLVLRDPETGACVDLGSTAPECLACGNCVPAGTDRTNRAFCGLCEGNDEARCLADVSCRAAYADPDGSFLGCWGALPMDASSSGACAGLDAYACSRRNDCSAWYSRLAPGVNMFDHCSDEPPHTSCAWAECLSGWTPQRCVQECAPCDAAGGASCAAECHATCVDETPCSDTPCSLGETCVERCPPAAPGGPARCDATCELVDPGDPGICGGAVTCAASPPSCPAGTTAGVGDGCYTGYCIPLTACSGGSPGSCAREDSQQRAPACPASTAAGMIGDAYTGYCIPLAACGGSSLGTCEPATGGAAPPSCPDGTIPGTIDGRYTGACIPQNQCPRLPCDGLFTEVACAARSDCRAIGSGVDCTCTADSCSCPAQQFERCEAVASVGSLAGARHRR